MKKELRRAFSSPLFFLSMIVFFLCLQGFALPTFSWATIVHGLPIYIEICLGLAFSAGIWSIATLAAAV